MYNDPNQPSSPNGPPYGPPQQPPTRDTGPYGPSPQQPTQPPAPYGGPPITPFDQVQYAPTQYIQPPQVAPTPASLPPISPNPSAPSRRRSSRRGLWITLGAVVTGIVIALIAFFVLQVVFNGATARTAIDDYYQAVMQQDYNKAYGYFDTARMTAREATLGQTIFVKAEQIGDVTYGRVTSYTITSATQLDDQNATVAVDFTRRGKVYHAQYSMKKVDGSWKIEQVQQ